MQILELALGVTKMIATAGTSAVITNAVKHTTPDDLTKVASATVRIGTVVISSLVSSAVNVHVEKQFVGGVKTLLDVREEFNKGRAAANN